MLNSKLFSLLILLFTCFTAFGQNPKVVNNVATYTASKNIGKKFQVPNTWTKIVINKNVKITGSFYMPTRTTPIEIMGMDRATSIIQGDGSRPTDDGINGRSYSAIRADKSPNVYVHDLTITKPMKFHIHGGFGNVTVERCNIIAGSETHTTDGIHGGAGKTVVKNCYIDVFDDALYTIECKLVENTTIVHNQNGSPFMTSWGASVPSNHTCIIRNCKVIANSSSGYNNGVFGWAGKNDDVAQTINIKIEGSFTYEKRPGKVDPPMYTIGRPRNQSDIRNATMRIDGNCPRKTSVQIRDNPTTNKVVFVNCPTAAQVSDQDLQSKTIVGEQKSAERVSIFPNPAQNTLQIRGIDQDQPYQIFTVSGKLISVGIGNTVEVSGLSNGLYIIQLNDKKLKFVKN